MTAGLPQQVQFSLSAAAAWIELLSTPKPIPDPPATKIAGAMLKAHISNIGIFDKLPTERVGHTGLRSNEGR